MLSPILGVAIRAGSPNAPLVLLLVLALGLALDSDSTGRRLSAAGAGLAAGVLAASGVAAFAAAAVVVLAWLTVRSERRAQGLLALGGAAAVVLVLALAGRARSPLDYGPIAPSMPPTTLESVVRCSGASFTRVIGIEFQLVVPMAREILPLTLLFVALMAWGAARLPARARGLLVTGTSVPFALGALMAVVTGHVAPMQADRLMAALPFGAGLVAAGLASLRGWPAAAAGAAVAGALALFRILALG